MAKHKGDYSTTGAGDIKFNHGADGGEIGEGKTAPMQNTKGTRLPMAGAPRRPGKKSHKSGSKRMGMDY